MIEAEKFGRQQGQLGRMIAIIVANMHACELLDGGSIARNFRLDEAGGDNRLMVEVADLIDRTISRAEREGPAGLRGID